MKNPMSLTACAALSTLALSIAAQAAEPAYKVLKPVSVTGTAVPAVVSYEALPLDRSWAQLSSREVELVRNQYVDLRAHEEPPFPAGGLAKLADDLSALQRQQNLRGELHAVISVDANGRAKVVSWQMKPEQGPVAGLDAIIERTVFEPATCAHAACAMEFPLHVEFTDTMLAFN